MRNQSQILVKLFLIFSQAASTYQNSFFLRLQNDNYICLDLDFQNTSFNQVSLNTYSKSLLVGVYNSSINETSILVLRRSLNLVRYLLGFDSIQICEISYDELPKYIKLDNQPYQYLLFDYHQNHSQFINIIPDNHLNPYFILRYLSGRYNNVEAHFHHDVQDVVNQTDISWAHARGNYKLFPTGSLSPCQSSIQYTRASHMFVLLNHTEEGPTSPQSRIFPPTSLLGFFIVPAIGLNSLHFRLSDLKASKNDDDPNFNPLYCWIWASDCRLRLLRYFAEQRHTAVWVFPWAIPSLLHFPSPPVSCQSSFSNKTDTTSNVTYHRDEYTIGPLDHCLDSGCTNYTSTKEGTDILNTGSGMVKEERQPWIRLQLPPSLTSRLTDEYSHQRNIFDDWLDSDGEGGWDDQVEPLISTVFNQLDTPTYHVPISDSLMNDIEAVLMTELLVWLGGEKECRHETRGEEGGNIVEGGNVGKRDRGNDRHTGEGIEWEVTGRYGVREYRRGAVVNWHVDPVENQPITVILHAGSGYNSVSNTDNIPDDSHSFGNQNKNKCRNVQANNCRFNCEGVGEKVCHGECTSSARACEWDLQIARLAPESALSPTGLAPGDAEGDKVCLAVGEFVMLETGRVPHARLSPLQADWYGNIFFHFRPEGWEKTLPVGL